MPAMRYGLDQRTTQDTAAELIRLQQELALAAQRRAEAEQAAELKRQMAADADRKEMEAILADPIAKQKLDLQQEMVRNRRDVRAMSPAEESGFLGGGEPMGGGVEAMRPRAGVPLGPLVGPPAGQGGIERGITAPSFSQPQTISDVVPRVRGGRPRITEGAEAPTRTTAKLRGLGPGNEFQGGMVAADSPEPPRRIMSRAAFTDRDTPITELRQQADRRRDPNFPDAVEGRMAEASATPEVLSSIRLFGGRQPMVPGQLGPLADLVMKDPELLKQLNPTLRGQVLNQIAQGGQAPPNRQAEAVTQTVNDALQTVQRLKRHPGFAGAVGAPSPLQPGSLPRALGMSPIPGSASAGFARYIDTLKAQLALPNLSFLRGLGHMSDREFKAITDSVTALDQSMSEADFTREIARIEQALEGTRQRLSGGALPTPQVPDDPGQDDGGFVIREIR